MRLRLSLILPSFLVLLLGGNGQTFAQERPAKGAEGKGAIRPKKVIEMEAIEVVGKVQKPFVQIIGERGDLTFHAMPLERNLEEEIEKTVDIGVF